MDINESARFLDRLYAPGDEFEVAYIHPTTKTARRLRKKYLQEHDALMEEFGRAEVAGFNVYVSVLPIVCQEAKVYDRVWVDQDDVDAPWPFAADPAWEGHPWPAPTTLVATSEESNGKFRWQAIFRLRDTMDTEPGRAFIKRLAAKAGADPSVHDLRRVLRVPGILNAKRGSMARLVSTRDERIAIDSFDLPEVSAVDRLLTMTVSSPHHVLGEWLKGASEGERSRKAYVTARFLKGCGVAYMDAAAILKLGALRSEPPLEDRELEHALDSAYHRKD